MKLAQRLDINWFVLMNAVETLQHLHRENIYNLEKIQVLQCIQ